MVSGILTNKAKNTALDRTFNLGKYSYIKYFQVGMCNKTPEVSDTSLYAPIPLSLTNVVLIDSCDATTGWTASNDATGVTLDTTAGNRLEGTGSLDLLATYSSGTASYDKTVTSFDGSNSYLFFAFYLNSVSKLVNTTDTISIDLGTGGFSDYDTYNFNYGQLETGWNAIVCDIGNSDSSTGSGVTITSIDSIRANIKINSDLTNDDVIMDWINTYPVADTFGEMDSGYPVQDEALRTITNRFTINNVQANGYYIREFGLFDSTKSVLYSRDVISTITKDQYINLIFEQTDKLN